MRGRSFGFCELEDGRLVRIGELEREGLSGEEIQSRKMVAWGTEWLLRF